MVYSGDDGGKSKGKCYRTAGAKTREAIKKNGELITAGN